VEYIHILFIYIVVRNDAKDVTTTAATMAAASAAAAAGAEGNNSCSKLWRQEQKWLLCLTRAASMEDRRRARRRKERHCACARLCSHDKARDSGGKKIRVCGSCMPLSPSKLSIFIFIFMPIMFPLNLPILEDQNYFFFHANYVPFKFVKFWGIKFYFSFHANYVPLKLVIFWGFKTSFFFMPIVFPFNFCHFLGINSFCSRANYVPCLGSNFLFMPIMCPLFGIGFSFHANYIPSRLPLFWDPFLFHANYVPFQIFIFFGDQIFFSCKLSYPLKLSKFVGILPFFPDQFLFHATIMSRSKLSNFLGSYFFYANYVHVKIVNFLRLKLFPSRLCPLQNYQIFKVYFILFFIFHFGSCALLQCIFLVGIKNASLTINSLALTWH
jgi:hypothetical protein